MYTQTDVSVYAFGPSMGHVYGILCTCITDAAILEEAGEASGRLRIQLSRSPDRAGRTGLPPSRVPFRRVSFRLFLLDCSSCSFSFFRVSRRVSVRSWRWRSS